MAYNGELLVYDPDLSGQYRGKLSNFPMQLTVEQDAFVIGTLLGDGCLERRAHGVRLRIEHSLSQESYVRWKQLVLGELVTGTIMPVKAFHKKYRKFYESVRLYTFTDVVLLNYWDHFYPEGEKCIPLIIEKLLRHPLSLAVWLMDDGYKRNDCNAFRLNTDSFTKNEQELLCDALRNNFGIKSSVHKKGKYWNIYIPQKSAYQFADLVRPYIIPDLAYKIALTP